MRSIYNEKGEVVAYNEDACFVMNFSEYGRSYIQILKEEKIDNNIKEFYLQKGIIDLYDNVFINKHVFADNNNIIYAKNNMGKDLFNLIPRYSKKNHRVVTDIVYKVIKLNENNSIVLNVKLICGKRLYKYNNIKIRDCKERKYITTSIEDIVNEVNKVAKKVFNTKKNLTIKILKA